MRITKKQVDSINNQCANGWELDVQYFLFHGEKTLIKQIQLDDENYLEFAIRYNYKNQVSLHISKFYHKVGEDYSSTNGMGKNKILDETQVKRRNINNLVSFTKNLNDEKLLEINKKYKGCKRLWFDFRK